MDPEGGDEQLKCKFDHVTRINHTRSDKLSRDIIGKVLTAAVMPWNVSAGVGIEVSPRSTPWMLAGILGGLAVGFLRSSEENRTSDIVHCAVLGGMAMSIVSEILYLTALYEPPLENNNSRDVHLNRKAYMERMF
ncbi:UNVERIFIED_CONTAM: hypothetical protein PYX00_008302 [Menopon gallinae]|uniref:Uncharacterized protein n=1 Tax=Menopon gallinae TaxID=328185 RepID=A0AAW2HMQ9_9NEOP